jgi:hypothetical protein
MQGLSDEADEIARAEQRATSVRPSVPRRVQRDGRSGAGLTSLPHAQWLLAVAALSVGAAATIAVVRRARSRPRWLAAERDPSRFQNLAKAAGLWLLRLASRRIAQEIALRLTEQPPAPAAAAAPSRPSAVQ